MIKSMREPKALPKSVATLFFLVGVTSAFSFRAIIIVQHSHPSYVRLLWYLAVITNLIFFLFRYHISRKRKHAVHGQTLITKLEQGHALDPQERKGLTYLLTSIERSRENLNYLIIFILSISAIIIDIVITLRSQTGG